MFSSVKSRKARKTTKKKAKYSNPIIGGGLYDRQRRTLKTLTLFQAVNGSSITGSVSVDTSSVFTTFSNFGPLVTTLWQEYRVDSIRMRWVPTPNSGVAQVFIPGLFVTVWRNSAPTATVAGIIAYPYHKQLAADKNHTICVSVPQDDPESLQFRSTGAASPVLFGITAAWNSGPVTATITYASVEIEYVVSLRGAKM